VDGFIGALCSCDVITVHLVVCVLKAILKGDEEVRAWLDYELVPLDEVSVFLLLLRCL